MTPDQLKLLRHGSIGVAILAGWCAIIAVVCFPFHDHGNYTQTLVFASMSVILLLLIMLWRRGLERKLADTESTMRRFAEKEEQKNS